MARISWKARFDSMLANPLLVGRDRTFIESLHRHWTTKKAMTKGRKFHFLKMEEKLERLAKAEPADAALAAGCVALGDRQGALRRALRGQARVDARRAAAVRGEPS